MSPPDSPTHAALIAARASYGRLLAWLAWQWRDIAAAEDALADAFAAALADWPAHGVPLSPEGWLMTVAKRQLLKAARRQKLAQDPRLTILFESGGAVPEMPSVPDDRLRLMFVCAHPAVDPGMRCALMLQTVLGIEAARIAQAFLVSAEAMTKRLVRAKAKIKAAGIRFEEPQADELEARVHAVLEGIYGAYVLDGGPAEAGTGPGHLAEEALYLAGVVADLLPGCAEALGLQALLLLCEARRGARVDEDGRFLPLDRQDPQRWNRAFIDQAGMLLQRAAGLHAAGPYQLEAAIQAAHCHRVHGGGTPWADIERLYQNLLELAPTMGARLGHAMAVAQAEGDARAGLRLLDAIEPGTLAAHQPWWAVRAHLLAQAGDLAAASQAYGQAHALSTDPAVRAYLAAQMQAARAGAAAGRDSGGQRTHPPRTP